MASLARGRERGGDKDPGENRNAPNPLAEDPAFEGRGPIAERENEPADAKSSRKRSDCNPRPPARPIGRARRVSSEICWPRLHYR